MKTVRFIFGIHNHQPVGNFDFVFEEAYKTSYLPFIETLEDFPTIKMSIHFSGCLIEWLEEHHPEYLDRIATLVKNGNLEMISAGFYEPVLAVIPDHDKIQQIKKLNKYIISRFDYTPETAWLTERVWEPHLPKPIKRAGIKYVITDDFHFLSSGKKPSELNGYFLTDEQGSEVGVFPISQKLRYAIPFQDPSVTLDILREYATEEGDNVVVMADDGEKFGVWPGTYDHCYTKGWLRKFFQTLVDNSDWVHTTTFKDYGNEVKPRGRVYLPTVSYFEMNEWTLPAESGTEFDNIVHELQDAQQIERYRPFLRGGTWRGFQSLYHESNWMQKRMTEASWRLDLLKKYDLLPADLIRGVEDDLWRSQCNCAYWHGIFGGLYLPHLRHAIYMHLIRAEKILNKYDKTLNEPRDIDRDGGLEAKLLSNNLQVISSQRGGTIREIDLLDFDFNLSNGMRRYSEAYHRKLALAGKEQSGASIHDQVLVKEEGLEKYLTIDTYDRTNLTDHFIPEGVSQSEIENCSVETTPFSEKMFNLYKHGNTSDLFHKGLVMGIPTSVTKSISIDKNTIDVSITIENLGEKPLSCLYGSEWNFSLLGGDTPDRFYEINGEKPIQNHMASTGSHNEVNSISLSNEWDGFKAVLNFPVSVDIWRFPVYTVSMSEAGFEKVYQSSVVIPLVKLDLAPGEQKTISMNFIVEHIK